jgi:hypothetical protein
LVQATQKSGARGKFSNGAPERYRRHRGGDPAASRSPGTSLSEIDGRNPG